MSTSAYLKRKLQVDMAATNISISTAVRLNFKFGNQSVSTLTFSSKPKLKQGKIKEIQSKKTEKRKVYSFKGTHISLVLTLCYMLTFEMAAKKEERRKLPSAGSFFHQQEAALIKF